MPSAVFSCVSPPSLSRPCFVTGSVVFESALDGIDETRTTAGRVFERSGSCRSVQDGADADVRGAFLDCDAVVLTRSHGEVAQTVLLGELAQAAEVRTRGLGIVARGRHRHQPAYVVVELEEARKLLRRDARLRRLAGEIDLDERRNRQPLRRRLGGERVTELADVVDARRL